jgi:hypothetical protein
MGEVEIFQIVTKAGVRIDPSVKDTSNIDF